ncbi:MAG: lysylphosphatidylglycerol synthase transmembrane domain-containing protein [Pseudomonadota bacterium]
MIQLSISLPQISWRLVRIVFTAALLALIWHAADGPALTGTLANANPLWIIAAVLALICQTYLSACRWQVTAAALGQTIQRRHAVQEYFMGQAVNQSLPGGVIGDAARAVRAKDGVGLARSGLAVGLERLAGQLAMFFTLTFAFVATYLSQGGLDWPAQFAAPIAFTLGSIFGATAVLTLIYRYVPFLSAEIRHWIDMACKALFSADVLPAQLGLGLAITLCNLAAFGFCALAVGVPLSVGALFAIVPLILFTMVIPITISGWGLREGSAAVLLPIAGIPMTEAVATSILFGLALIIAVVPGFIALVSR